jgi:hypothetical protein
LSPLTIVWPCHLSVESYAALGRDVEVGRPECPSCQSLMSRWSGYWRTVRHDDTDHRIFVPRALCRRSGKTHALLPAFVVARRLYDAGTIGAVIEEVADGKSGVRPAAAKRGILHETARGWVRRFGSRAPGIAASFSALSVELGGEPVTPIVDDSVAYAVASIRAAFTAAESLPGWIVLGLWRFVSCVVGGRLLAANTNFPYLIVGRRRFMPPVPKYDERNQESDGP